MAEDLADNAVLARATRGSTWTGPTAFLLPAAVALTVWLPDLSARFGMDFDGFNAAIWALGADAIGSDGLWATRLGAHRGDFTYGNHPPLTVLATWASRSILGPTHLATRLPAVLASLVALYLLTRLVRVLDFDNKVAVLAVPAGTLAPMYLAFGSMLDTWIVGLPFGITVLLTLAERRSTGGRAAAAAACAMCSWQGSMLVALALPVAVRRFGLRSSIVAGSAGGVAGALAYDVLVGGGGALEVGWPFDGSSLLFLQASFLWTLPLIPVALLVKDRAVGFLAVAAPATYAVAFTDHADRHDYWLYWWLVPAVLGAAVLIARFEDLWPGIAVCVGALALTASLHTGGQEGSDDAHADAVAVLTAAIPADQRWVPLVGGASVQPWIEYEADRRAVRVATLEEVPVGFRVVVFDELPGIDCHTAMGLSYEVCSVSRP